MSKQSKEEKKEEEKGSKKWRLRLSFGIRGKLTLMKRNLSLRKFNLFFILTPAALFFLLLTRETDTTFLRLTRHVELDPEVQRGHAAPVAAPAPAASRHRLLPADRGVHSRQGSHLLSNGLLRVQPPHDVGRVSGREETRRPGVVEHEPKVLALVQLQVRENLVQEGGSLRLLVHVKQVVRIVQELDLKKKRRIED